MRTILLSCLLLPLTLWGQAKTWQLEPSIGSNLSVNQMKTILGDPSRMSNSIRPGGFWSLLMKYQWNEKFSLLVGINHVSYKYHYRYRIDRGSGGASKSTVYLWGFPIGLENKLLNKHISFAIGYGVQYRFNHLGSPFNLSSSSQIYNLNNDLVLDQKLQEFEVKQQAHMLSLFSYIKLIFDIKPRFDLAISVCYNQGLQKHEGFKFKAINRYPLNQDVHIDIYEYYSRASYLSAGLTFNILLEKKEEKSPHSNIPLVTKD